MADCLNNEEQVVSGLSSENEDSLKSEINNGDLLSSNVDNGDIVTSNAVLDEAISSTIQEDGAINSTLDLHITTSGSTVNVIDNLMSTDTKSALSSNQGRVLNELINGVKTDLKNYYTKSEVNSLITAIPKFAIKVVNSLPAENISSATVYLLASGNESQNLYTEYIYINGVWEKLGEQKVDLSGYQTIEAFNTAIADYYTKTEIDTIVEQINEGLVKELQSPVDVYNTPEGVYRIPANCEILHPSGTIIPSEAYILITDAVSDDKKFFTIFYNTHNTGEKVQQYMGFGEAYENYGYYYVTNLSSLTGYVDTSTDQTIRGLKTFSQAPKLYGSLSEELDDKSLVSAEWVNDKLDDKQDTLTAGNNVTITDGIISADLTGSAPIILLESPIRIWDLDSGIYKVPANATIYYNGATSTSSIPYFNAGSSILIVNNLVSTTAVPIPNPYKKYILFASINEGLQKSGFVTGKVLADTGSYWFFDTETDYLPTSGGTMEGPIILSGAYPQIKSTQADLVLQTNGGKQYDFTDTEFRPTASNMDTLGIGRTDRRFKDGYFSGTVYATGGFSGNATSSTKATKDSDGNQINTTYTKIANNILSGYGTCPTGASTSAKVVTIADTNWKLKVGTIIGVKFTTGNTASNVTLNVNSTGAKSIFYNNAVYTGNNQYMTGRANTIIFFMYDGTYWVWFSQSNNNDDDNVPSAISWTASGTQAKTATCSNYVLLKKSYIQVIMANANTYAGAITMNINGRGAKPIYIDGVASSSSNYNLPAGSYLTYYDGTNYYFRTDGKLPSGSTSLVPKGNYDTLSATSGNTYTAPANGWFAWSMESTSSSYSHVSLTNNTNGMMIRHAQTATGAGNRGIFPAKKGDVVKFESSNNNYNWFRFYYGEEV